MRWSAQKLAPCNKSSACPSANSLLASMRQISETTPAHCSAKPVQLPTNPPPPMMEIFTASPHERRLLMPRYPPLVGLFTDALDQAFDLSRRVPVYRQLPAGPVKDCPTVRER